MMLRKFASALVCIALPISLIGMATNASAQTQSSTAEMGAPGTVWGTAHLKLEVTAEGANLDFDCASGTIPNPVAIDAAGDFRLKGTFTRERPGPVMRDGNTAAVAIYAGSIKGDTMLLTITAGALNESVGEYVLVRGKHGRVIKCR